MSAQEPKQQSTKKPGPDHEECGKKEKSAEANSDDKQNVQVHSANSWETADLGDKGRNEKFLRLMGAAKKEHHGKFVIGDHTPVHVRPKKDDEQLKDELVEQYEQSMEHRLAGGPKGHRGLGFHTEEKEDNSTKKDGDQSAEVKAATGGDNTSEDTNKTDDEKSREKDERRRESLDRKREGAEESPNQVKKMKFVKSSS